MSYSTLFTVLACILVIVLYKLHESKSTKLRSVQLEYESFLKSSKSSQDEQTMLFKEELETLKKDSLEKIELSKKQIEQLESQLREYTVKNEKLVASEDKSTSEALSLMRKISAKEKESDQLKHDLEQAQKHGEKLAQDYKFQLNTQIEKLAVEKDSRIAELEELVATIKRETLYQRELFKTTESDKEDTITELRQSLSELQKKIDELEHSNKDQVSKNNQLIKDFDQLQKDLEDLRSAYKTIHEDYAKVSGDLDDTRKALVDLKERAEMLVNSETNLGNELNVSKSKNHELSEKIDSTAKELQIYQAFFKKCEFYIEDLKRFDPGFAEIAKHLEQVATTYEAVSSGEDYHSDDEYLSDTKQGEVDQNEFAILTKKASKNTFTLIERYIEELRARVAREKSLSGKNGSENIDLKKAVAELKKQLSDAESRNVTVLSIILESRNLVEDELSKSPVNEKKLKEVFHNANQNIENCLKTGSYEKDTSQSDNKLESRDKDSPSHMAGFENGTALGSQNLDGVSNTKEAEQKRFDGGNVLSPPDSLFKTRNSVENKKEETVDTIDVTVEKNDKTNDNNERRHSPNESTLPKDDTEEMVLSKSHDTPKPTAKNLTLSTSNKVEQPLSSMWASKKNSHANSDADSGFSPLVPVFKTVQDIFSTSPPALTSDVKENIGTGPESGASKISDKSKKCDIRKLDVTDKTEKSESDNFKLTNDEVEDSSEEKNNCNEGDSKHDLEASVSNQGADSDEGKSTLEKIDEKLREDVIAEEKTTQDEKLLAKEEAEEDKEILSRYNLRAAENEGDEGKEMEPSIDPLSEDPAGEEGKANVKEEADAFHSIGESQSKFEAFKRDIEDAKDASTRADIYTNDTNGTKDARDTNDTNDTDNDNHAKDSTHLSETHSGSVSEQMFNAFKRDIRDAKEIEDSNEDLEDGPIKEGKDTNEEAKKGSIKESIEMHEGAKDDVFKSNEVKGEKVKTDGAKNADVKQDEFKKDDHLKDNESPSKDEKLEEDSKFKFDASSLASEDLNGAKQKIGRSHNVDNVENSNASIETSKLQSKNEGITDTKSGEDKPISKLKSEEDAQTSTSKSENTQSDTTSVADKGEQFPTYDSNSGEGSTSSTLNEVDSKALTTNDNSTSVGIDTAQKIVSSREHIEQVIDEVKNNEKQKLELNDEHEEKSCVKEANNNDKLDPMPRTDEQGDQDIGKRNNDEADSITHSFDGESEEMREEDEEMSQSRGSIESEITTNIDDTLSLGHGESNDEKSAISNEDIDIKSTSARDLFESSNKSSNSKSNSASPTKMKSKKGKKKKSKSAF